MTSLARLACAGIVASLVPISFVTRADGREELIACQVMIDRAAPSAQNSAASSQEDVKLQRCRQIVRDWTLRESRMSVDEQGRPLR